MERKSAVYHRFWIDLIKFFNIILVTLPFWYVWKRFYSGSFTDPYLWRGNVVITALFVVLFYAFGRTYGAFQISVSYVYELYYNQTLALFFTNLVMIFITTLINQGIPVMWPMVFAFAAEWLMVLIWSLCAHTFYYKFKKADKTVIIWDMKESLEQLVDSYGMGKRFDVIRNMHIDEAMTDIPKSLEGATAVFLCGIHSHERNQIIKYCIANGIRAYIIPRIGDVIMSGAKNTHLFHLPIQTIERYCPSATFTIGKRLFDIVSSLTALIVLSPLMLITALLIKLDGGPAFYKQTRLTQNGKEFTLYKFRSMRMDAEKDGIARLSTGENDERVTKIGKFIRTCRIDELPQLINILRGEMSVVGPRPERPEIAAQYEEEMPEFKLRLQAKAGLTGRAQVFGKYNTTPYDKLLMDLQYIAHPSIAEDLRLIFATFKVLAEKVSTEGVDEDQITAQNAQKFKKQIVNENEKPIIEQTD